jgi:hypothetical protein
MNEIILNSNTCHRALSAADSRKVHKMGPTQTLRVGSTHLGQAVGDTVATRLLAKLQALQSRQGFTKDAIHMFTFSHISNSGILITISI